MSGRQPGERAGGPRRGFTLVEAAVSVVLVALTLVAALTVAGAAARGQRVRNEVQQGLVVAGDLMSEILRQRYAEPGLPDTFGRGATEGSDNRSGWDDVDDYDGWSSNPPTTKDGAALPGCEGWRRKVHVDWVSWSDPEMTVSSNEGLKRIEVIAVAPSAERTRLKALRSQYGPLEQLPAAATTYVSGARVKLRREGQDAPAASDACLWNQVPTSGS